jgi:hypothetical protein
MPNAHPGIAQCRASFAGTFRNNTRDPFHDWRQTTGFPWRLPFARAHISIGLNVLEYTRSLKYI